MPFDHSLLFPLINDHLQKTQPFFKHKLYILQMIETSLITRKVKNALEKEASPQKLPSLQRVDIICAYLQESGLLELKPFFQDLASRKPPVPVRIFTTSQWNTTEPEAVHRLALLPKVEIKVFKATSPTFHAKGWLFVHQGETADVAIVGSSNMSKSAISTGIEWNISTTAGEVILEFQKVFESYWSGKHAAFGEKNVLDYDPKCDWESLCELFPSQAEPKCSDTTGKCNHSECQKLSKELAGLEKRRDQILHSFSNGKKDRPRKRSRPSEISWNISQRPAFKKSKMVTNVLKQNSGSPPLDPMETDENNQVSSKLKEELRKHLYDAILRNDETMARMKIEEANQLSHDILKDDVDNSILITSRESRGDTSLDIYDFHYPLLFATAYSCEPNIVKMLIGKGAYFGPFRFDKKPDRFDNFFAVLARLPPQKACGIFKEIIRMPQLYALPKFNYWRSIALGLAKWTSKKYEPRDESFVEELSCNIMSQSGTVVDVRLR